MTFNPKQWFLSFFKKKPIKDIILHPFYLLCDGMPLDQTLRYRGQQDYRQDFNYQGYRITFILVDKDIIVKFSNGTYALRRLVLSGSWKNHNDITAVINSMMLEFKGLLHKNTPKTKKAQ